MFLCDFFVHGAGGAAYEDVGNRLFTKVFRANPPVFGMATGTWSVDPEGSRALEAIGSFEAGIQEWRRYLEKNPEAVFTRSGSWRSGLPPFMHPAFEAVLADAGLRKLTDEKASLVGRLQDPARREEAARRIKTLNEGLGDGVREARKVLEQGLLDVEKVRETREVLSFREYPFFCYEPGLFAAMKDRVREAAHLEKA
jgi:hypothetical protein